MIELSEERTMFETPIQYIDLERLPAKGHIIDIGGGGEGLVARIEREKVCAVDYRMDEIYEARIHDPPANWFVSDAASLCFKDESFDVATMWFSLGYMRSTENKQRVLGEVHRVIKEEGVLSVLASKIVCEEDVFIIHVEYTLPDGTPSKTGYGVRGNQDQTIETTRDIIEKTGFDILETQDNDYWFKMLVSKTKHVPKA